MFVRFSILYKHPAFFHQIPKTTILADPSCTFQPSHRSKGRAQERASLTLCLGGIPQLVNYTKFIYNQPKS